METIPKKNEKNAHSFTIKKNKDLLEIVRYANEDFPIKVEMHYLSMFVLNSFGCHWHNEIEILTVLNGRMKCYVEDNEVILNEGMGIVISSNRLHYAKGIDDEDCDYVVIIIEPEFLAEKNGFIYKKYVEPIVYNKKIPYTLFDKEKNEAAFCQVKEMLEINTAKKAGYELDSCICMLKIWREIVKIAPVEINENTSRITYVKEMLTYIHENYKEDISVNELADYVNLSYGEACRLFKKSMKQTIVGYIQSYRIKKSISLLKSGEYNISEIAAMVGFNGASYYSEIFKKVIGKTPNEFKKE